MNVLVTGASGFVGSALISRLISEDKFFNVLVAIRRTNLALPASVKCILFNDILSVADWESELNDVDAVVHCAARVHVMSKNKIDSLEAYRKINVEGTLSLAKKASASGVKRFIFISSVKVNGESTSPGVPFTSNDLPAPLDPYGVSKMEAELGLRELQAQTGMEVVIVRPTLVYGPGVKANFANMMRWVARGVPLPLGSIHNARSLVAIDNLVDFLVTCLKHPAAAGQTFFVSDGEDVSTTELLRRTAHVMGKKVFLLPVPSFIIIWCAAILGKHEIAQRICGSLQVDIAKNFALLGWKPPLNLDKALESAVKEVKK